ncbi:MAG: alkaline phosphatase family protein [Chloroflexi bacterium]|nr:alkaline phosphatase family protein [Chloroflexota bacterium]
MPSALLDRLRAREYVLPDYNGRGLLAVPATVLSHFGAHDASDPAPLADLRPELLAGVKVVVVLLADGLGEGQLDRLRAEGHVPFLASVMDRADRGQSAQLLRVTTIFPSTTAAAITTLNTARTPQEHGNIAYFLWLEEFAQVTQMLRWGPGISRRGSYFDDATVDPVAYRRVRSIHGRLRERGVPTFVVEPELFRKEAMTKMHAAEATYVGYILPTTLEVRVRDLLRARPWGDGPAYVYAYWSGIDTAAHQYGPNSPEHDAEASALDNALGRALAGRAPGDVLVLLTADHGHAAIDPDRLIDLEADLELRALLRNPIAGEPRVAFLHTDEPDLVKAHLSRTYGDAFFLFDRDEAIASGLFGRGEPDAVRRRVGEVCAMLGDDRAASIVRIDGAVVHHYGAHGGLTAAEMNIPILAWRA